MNPIWQNNNSLNDLTTSGNQSGAHLCPLTNSDRCAVLANGWQPQELCHALNCDQLKSINSGMQNKDKAA